MLNLNKKTYLLIFSTLYVIGLIIGGFFQNIFYYFTLNGIFTIGGIWSVYFMMSDKHVPEQKIEEVVEDIPVEKIEEIEEEIPEPVVEIKPKTQPNITDTVYIAEEISEEDLLQIIEENKSWYNKMNTNIKNSISDMKKKLEGEDEEIEHGKE